MKRCILFILALCGAGWAGDLPQLDRSPWIGWFAGSEMRGFRFGVNRDGKAFLIPYKTRREVMSDPFWIRIDPVIEETQPDGKVVNKPPQKGKWEALTEASDKPGKIGYRGTVAGGARFEVWYETEGQEIRGGGRLVEAGELKNPLRFALRLRVPNVYQSRKEDDALWKILKKDRILLTRGDGTELRYDSMERIDAQSEEMSGTGISQALVQLEGYDGTKLELDSGETGIFGFWNNGDTQLYKGFTFVWTPDPVKNADGEGRFLLKFK